MNNILMTDSRLKSKIESLDDLGNSSCSVKFKDIDDMFFFNDKNDLQEFLHNQAVERFYDKELRKGYFDYTNENGELLRYHIKVQRGSIISYTDECIS